MNLFYKYLGLSVLIHLLILLLLWWVRPLQEPWQEEQSPIFVTLVNNEHKELADIEPPADQRRPDKSRFLGIYNSSVQKEQVARMIGRSDDRKKVESPGRPSVPSSELYQLDEKLFEKSDRQQQAQKEALGEPLPEDFYPDFQRGSHTYLNVLRFPEAECFVRLKRIFKLAWNPEAALRSAMVSNQIARGNVEVVLGVSIDRKGNLAEAFVYKSSGLPTFDEEALRTVRASAPFAKPPGKLLAGDDLLRMSWTFTVYF